MRSLRYVLHIFYILHIFLFLGANDKHPCGHVTERKVLPEPPLSVSHPGG